MPVVPPRALSARPLRQALKRLHSMHRNDEIFQGPEYFTCDRFHCRMRKEICVRRQQANSLERKSFALTPFPGCDKCVQGEKIMQLEKEGSSINNEQEKIENLCKECGEKPRLGNSPFCASCLGVRGNRAKAAKAKNKGAERPKKVKETQNKPKGNRVLNDANAALTLEFGQHASILKEVKRLADEQIRPVEYQIMYMLKAELNRINVKETQKSTIPTP